MATIFSLIAQKILAARPANFLPKFVSATINHPHVQQVTNPQGTYTSNMGLEDITAVPMYYQRWDSNKGIMMKTVGSDKPDYIQAGGGNDVIMGDTGKDSIIGGKGDDLIIGGGGDDFLYGQFGNNVIVAGYQMAANGTPNFLDSWKVSFRGCKTEEDVAAQFIPKSGDATAVGADGTDIILSGSGKDTVVGLGGNDTLFSGAGDDLVVGDAYKGVQGWSGGTQTGKDYIDAGAGDDTVYGGAGNDEIYGGIGKDTIWGETDPTLITGGAETGNDVIDGGAGNDTLYGGTGNDFYFCDGQFGVDTVVENAGEGTDDRVIFSDITLNDIQFSRSDNDLVFLDSSGSNGVKIENWFQNFGVDSIWFTTGTADQYNIVSSQALADHFGVTIPTSDATTGDVLTAFASIDNVMAG